MLAGELYSHIMWQANKISIVVLLVGLAALGGRILVSAPRG